MANNVTTYDLTAQLLATGIPAGGTVENVTNLTAQMAIVGTPGATGPAGPTGPAGSTGPAGTPGVVQSVTNSDGTLTVTGTAAYPVVSLTVPVTVAHGGTGGTSAGIALFNNITGYAASGATGTTSTNLVFSTSPTLVTPQIQYITDTLGNNELQTVATAGTGNWIILTNSAQGNGVNLAVSSTGSNDNLTINAQGSGTIGIGNVSTGALIITPATTITSTLTVAPTSTSASPLILNAPSGTTVDVLDIEINSVKQAYMNSSGVLLTGQLQPTGNNTKTLGASGAYWQYIYGSRLYVNSTAYLDGGTAGQVTIQTTGGPKFSDTGPSSGSSDYTDMSVQTSDSGSYTGALYGLYVHPIGNVTTKWVIGAKFNPYFNAATGLSKLSAFYAIPEAGGNFTGGTIANMFGFEFQAYADASGGTITTLAGISLDAMAGAGTATIGTYSGFQMADLSRTVTNQYGIYLNDLTSGTTSNVAIHTGKGLVQFGDATTVSATLTVQPTLTVASAAGATWNELYNPATTLTLTGTTTVTQLNKVGIGVSTITDSSAVTVSTAATLYVAGAPIAGGSVTITNGYALYVNGFSRIAGTLAAQTIEPFTTATYNLGTTSLYYSNLYSTVWNANSTASMSGSTAGQIAVTGDLLGTFWDEGGQVFNVKAYGAKGDGSTDDTTAIQNAINAAHTAGGGQVFFPAATYKITSALLLYSGSSPTITAYSNITLAGAGASGAATVIAQATTGADVIQAQNDAHNGAQSTNITIKNMTLNFSGTATNSGNGIYFKQNETGGPSFQQCNFENVVVENMQGSGKYAFNFESMIVSTLDTCMAVACANGFYLDGAVGGAYGSVSTSVTFLNCYANMAANAVIGYNIYDCTYISMVGCACDVGGNMTTAYQINGSNAVALMGCATELDGTHTLTNGFYIEGGSAGVGLYDCYVYQSKSTIDFYVTGSSVGVTLIGPADNSSVSGSTGLKVDSGSIVTVSDPVWGAVATPYTNAGTLTKLNDGAGNMTVPGVITTNSTIYNNHAITVTSNAGSASVSYRLNTFTNSSAAAMTITIPTAGATDGQQMLIRIYDFSAVAETISWVNTENSGVSAPTTSNGSTTLPLTVGFIYNGSTSKWRCVASA